MKFEYDRKVGTESQKTYNYKLIDGFFAKYMTGIGIEPGYVGYTPGAVPILSDCIGVDLDYPGYDGKILPFQDVSQDYVYSSHTLEHIPMADLAIQEWYRVTKIGGNIIIVVPHQFLYEKKAERPSLYNGNHHHFFTPASLLKLIETSLIPNSYRVRHLRDEDKDFDYMKSL